KPPTPHVSETYERLEICRTSGKISFNLDSKRRNRKGMLGVSASKPRQGLYSSKQ
ncbi:mCG145901, partial [Mus musculus]